MSRIQEVLSANKNRAYPFVDDSVDGVIPNWMLLDLRLMDAGDRGTDVRLVGARVETGSNGVYAVDLTVPGVPGAVFTVECKPGSSMYAVPRVVSVSGLDGAVFSDVSGSSWINVDDSYWGEPAMVLTAEQAEESRSAIESADLSMPGPDDYDLTGHCYNFWLSRNPARSGGPGLSSWCSFSLKSARTVHLLFRYSDVDFSIPVQLGTGIVIGKAEPTPSLSIRYAVYGGGSEYAFNLADGDYDASANIIPSNVISLSKNRHLDGISGIGGTATGVVHVKDGYNTTARVYGNAVHVEVGNGIGLGPYCPEEPERMDCYYYGGKVYEDARHETEIAGAAGVVYDDIVTGRSYKWDGERFEATYDAFDCSKAFMFLNGQHANTSGNINIVGGSGVSVQTGRAVLVDGKYIPAITITATKAVNELLGPIYLWKTPEDEVYEPTGFPVGLQVVRSYDGFVMYRGVLSEENGLYSFAPLSGFQDADVEVATGQTGHIRIVWGVDASVDEYSMRLEVPGTGVAVLARFSNLQTDPTQEITAVSGLDGATFDGADIYVPSDEEGEDPVKWGSLYDLETRQTAPSDLSDTKFDRFGYCHNFQLYTYTRPASGLGSVTITATTTDWVDFVQEPDDVLELVVTDVEAEGSEDTVKKFEVTGLTIDGDSALRQYGVEWAEPDAWGDPSGS